MVVDLLCWFVVVGVIVVVIGFIIWLFYLLWVVCDLVSDIGSV